MQLLTYTDYALRVLLYVGAHPERIVSTASIAHAYGISVDHVAKAAKTLTRHGVLRATRGSGGGVSLAKSPREIRVGHVVRLFEGDRAPVQCLRAEPGHCEIAPACRLRTVLQRAEAAFYAELDRCSLEDLLTNRPQLVRPLAPTKAPRSRSA